MDATGGCLCGQVRFICHAAIGAAGYCHCEDCRRCTGSAFNISVRCPSAGFEVLQGSLGGYTKRGASGYDLTRHFCVGCGSPIYTSSPRDESVVFIKAGAFDDPAVVTPALEAWTRSKVAWSTVPSGLPQFERGRGEV